jgi:hypothetical protein
MFVDDGTSNLTSTILNTLTTHLPPLSNVTPLFGYIAIFICVIFWGIMYIPVKHYGNLKLKNK